MAIRKIAIRGEEILTKKCKPVKEVNDRIRTLAEDMIETMIDAEGVGLAAPQVGIMKRMFVARPFMDDQEEIFVMINPEIILKDGTQECTEGCLSVPNMIGLVTRPKHIKIKAADLEGKEQEYDFSDFAANVMCHEYDHLEGHLFTEKADQVLTQEEYEEMLGEMGLDEEGIEEIAEKGAEENNEKTGGDR